MAIIVFTGSGFVIFNGMVQRKNIILYFRTTKITTNLKSTSTCTLIRLHGVTKRCIMGKTLSPVNSAWSVEEVHIWMLSTDWKNIYHISFYIMIPFLITHLFGIKLKYHVILYYLFLAYWFRQVATTVAEWHSIALLAFSAQNFLQISFHNFAHMLLTYWPNILTLVMIVCIIDVYLVRKWNGNVKRLNQIIRPPVWALKI